MKRIPFVNTDTLEKPIHWQIAKNKGFALLNVMKSNVKFTLIYRYINRNLLDIK